MNVLINFLKSKLFPEWVPLGKTRMIVKREVDNYYELVQQKLYINLNDSAGERKWMNTIISKGSPAIVTACTLTKLVPKNSVTINEGGVAHYVTTKDPVEI